MESLTPSDISYLIKWPLPYFNTPVDFFKVWTKLGAGDGVSRGTAQEKLLEYLLRRENFFHEKILPILKQGYIPIREDSMKENRVCFTSCTFIDTWSLCRLIFRNQWHTVTDILELTHKYKDPCFVYLCAEFADGGESCGGRPEKIDRNWMKQFILKTDRNMWLRFANSTHAYRTYYDGDTTYLCCNIYLMETLIEIFGDEINTKSQTRMIREFIKKDPSNIKYQKYQDIYLELADDWFWASNAIKYMPLEAQTKVINHHLTQICEKTPSVNYAQWLQSQTSNTEWIETILTKIAKSWIQRFKSYKIGTPPSEYDYKSFCREIELVKLFPTHFMTLDNLINNWYKNESISRYRIYKWFARLEMFDVDWFTNWFDH